MNNFLVYKSSAGSGKTYTLMLVYLKIVLKDPGRYRNILAITFTNKAANEIKQRVLGYLKLVAEADEGHLQKKEENLIATLKKSTGLGFAELKRNAAQALTHILHNYSDFAVSTIDSFVHKVIRAFAFDLKLSLSFEVEMDNNMLLSMAVEDMLRSVGNDKELTEILVNFIQQKAEEDESWQIDRLLIDFAENLFKEQAAAYLPLIGKMNIQQLKETGNAISRFTKQFESEMAAFGKQAFDLIHSNGLDESLFNGKSKGIYNYFRKLNSGQQLTKPPTDSVKKVVAEDNWLSPDGKKSPLKDQVLSITPKLTDIFNNLLNYLDQNVGRYIILEMIRQQLYPMSVLVEIKKRLEVIKKERNVLPIAEFNRIISNIVSEEPVPFIYERIGEKFRHYMIDEFQDTSVLQWLNLMPLIENSLSQGGLNMIVGDGKQAIYRFRNGDVGQFVRLPEVDNPENNPIIEQRAAALRRDYLHDNLGSNFRSAHEVVKFNNDFFSYAAPIFLGEQSEVYAEVNQTPESGKTGGRVTIEFAEEDDKKLKEKHINRTYELVTTLCGEGYLPGDITVLCRTNAEAADIAVFLNTQGIKVVSSESLLLKNAPEVVFLAAWFSLLANADDDISRIAIANYLFENNLPQTKPKAVFYNETKDPVKFERMVEQAAPGFSVQALRDQSLFDLTEALIRAFNLQSRAPLYVQFFLDEVLKFTTSGSGGIPAFLDYWETKKEKLSVVLPMRSDAVQVMTIHKSKGLEFPVVIYPFATNKIATRASQIWVPMKDEAIPELKTAFLKLSKSLEDTIYEPYQKEEQNKRRLDLLNTIYVAFTRASERLYILSGKPAEKEATEPSITDLLVGFLQSKQIFKAGMNVFTFGEGNLVEGHAEKTEDTVLPLGFQSWPWQERLLFATRAPQHWHTETPQSGQVAGNILHQALAGIVVPGDVNKSVAHMVNSGLIATSEADELKQRLISILNHPEIQPFFESGINVINETEILTRGGKSYRPDRVILHGKHTDVIDYKSGKPMQYHEEQVSNYAKLLDKMGYPEVRSWLIYLEEPMKVVEVA
ncbi:MAG: UvrD-helicase domain-containing protein [Lentimicrobium sp.]|jgi:ATP-dependent exoDNAse (exonuclease V) beta subunit|nr:UvrD-helicase domain-containing protein [Lentimicrobium sp.]